MLSAFSKIKSEKFRLKETVEVWNLKFKSWETDFGEILTIHHELFDLNGMSGCAFALDPEYLTKKTHLSWSRNILDLKKAGIKLLCSLKNKKMSWNRSTKLNLRK